jgi:hypothetical protein
VFSSTATRQQNDRLKKLVSQANGITLIEIPFWWDRTRDSLISTIHFYRPDIQLPPSSAPRIQSEMPSNLANKKSLQDQYTPTKAIVT